MNSRLILAVSAAFAGPLIWPCSAEGGGIHFRGASSTGKSTALHVAGSVWGGGSVTGFVRSWRATSNGLEGVALGHCDTLLCLDELSQLASREAGEAGYMLANGSGKARSARDGSARRSASWRVMFLSSGEIGLADKIAEDGRGRKMAAGQRVRIVDVSSECYAIFDELRRCETSYWISDDRWAELLSDAEIFLSTWGSSARRLGWTALDLFGVHPIAPAARFDVMGLIPMLSGGRVTALTERSAIIHRESGAKLNYVRPSSAGAVLPTWIAGR